MTDFGGCKSVQKPLLGVIGGMGPLATACFYERLTRLQKVNKEQDYIDILLYSIPSAPDRTAYITGQSDKSPLDMLIKAGKVLDGQGVTAIAIPCVTSHYFYQPLQQALNATLIHIARETAAFAAVQGIKKAGLLATDGTVRGGFFQAELAERGIEALLPEGGEQVRLMRFIYDGVKRGEAADASELSHLAEGLRRRGAETVILGCTELSIAAGINGAEYIDVLHVLARASLTACGAELLCP
jgi:aspartate racemase